MGSVGAWKDSVLCVAVVVCLLSCGGDAVCSSGDDCANYEITSCSVGGTLYCCPGQYMKLRYDDGSVTSCTCEIKDEMGYSCSGNTGTRVTSATWSSFIAPLLYVLWMK